MSGNIVAAALAAGVLGIAGTVPITAASPSSAAPIVPGTAAVKALVSTPVSGVNYRRGRRYCGRHVYHLRYAHWRHGYPYADCGYTFPATCAYPYPYFGFVYGWHGIW